jgi:hypothetical protein
MKRHIKVIGVLLMIAWMASFAAAVQKPAVQTAGTTSQLVAGAQDVITASDAGGGYLTTRDILVIILIILGLAVLGVIAL